MVVVAVVGGCDGDSSDTNQFDPQVDDLFGRPTLRAPLNTYTTHSANRYFTGTGWVASDALKIDLSTANIIPSWVVAKDGLDGGTDWGVVDTDGRRATFRITDGDLSQLIISTPLEGEITSPPILVYDETRGVDLVHSSSLVQHEPELRAVLSRLRNLPDASTVLDGESIIYSYSDPTERYPHGALGDPNEWGGLAVGLVDGIRQPDRFRLDENEVFEGLFPLVADLDGDGRNEMVTTVSNPANGSRVVVFRYHDDVIQIIAESEPVGTGFRWLHQIAVAPFGPNGEIEIAVVETPHIGGIAKFYRLVGDELELVASEAGGYMSHVNGSRNLDQAVAGDFDGDGAVELIVPSRDQNSLIGLRRVGDSVEEVWELVLGSRLATNLAVVETDNGGLILGAATEDGTLHIWQ